MPGNKAMGRQRGGLDNEEGAVYRADGTSEDFLKCMCFSVKRL